MEKRGVMFGIAICLILVMTLAVLSAATNDSSNVSNNLTKKNFIGKNINGTRAHLNLSGNVSERIAQRKALMTEAKNVANMSFGQCVENRAKEKNTCFENRDKAFETCKNAINESSARANNQTERCSKNYDTSKATCKTNFKNAKSECGKIKHGFIDSVRYFFR